MGWPKPKGYSKSRVDWAGKALSSGNYKSKNEKDTALDILDNWRAIHRYPMHIFKKRLKRVAEKTNKEVFIAQRLKRLPSIVSKLQRKYNEEPAKIEF